MYKYTKLFSVICEHAYYAKGYTPDLAIVPAPACKKALKNLSLLMKPLPGGFQLFYAAREGEKHVLEQSKEAEVFSFFIQLRNPLFSHVSDLPFPGGKDQQAQIYYFSNKIASSKGEGLYLHPEARVTEEDRIVLMPPAFDYGWEQGKQPKTIKVVNEAGDSAFEKYIPNESIPGVFINLNKEPEGFYSIIADGKNVMDFYMATADPRAMFGLLHIHIGAHASAAYALKQDGSFTPQDYLIQFAARKTFWKYFFIIKNKSEYGLPEIYQDKKKAQFLKAEEVSLADGAPAYMLKSKDQIPLQQVQSKPYKLQLTDLENKKYSMDLPGPNISQLKPEVVGDETVYNSEIYVYI